MKIVKKQKQKKSNRQTPNLGNCWVKRLSRLTAARSLIINNKDVVRLECALTGIPVCWYQSFSTGWIHTHTLMHAHGSTWRAGKWYAGLTDTNICSSKHNKHCLLSIWESWHTSSNAYSRKIIILPAIRLYFKFFESHRGPWGTLYFSKRSPLLFPYSVILFPTKSSNQLSFQSHKSFL